jgi:acetylornithine deacetylase/succinyl-diaminopimelate desuccinylase-like protein
VVGCKIAPAEVISTLSYETGDTATTASIPDLTGLARQAVSLTADYIRIDTTNPPGDVSRAADWLQAQLAETGINSFRLGPSQAKPNVVATLGDPGLAGGPFVLAHHMDVVPAPPAGWSADPFAGEVRDGYLYGRGAMDMKTFGVLTMLCAAELKRLAVPLKRALRILATSDEEVGGIDGAKWLAEYHFEDVRGEFLLTEGAFGRVNSRMTYYPIQVAEKGVTTVKLTARGKPGHASVPRPDNAVLVLARALARLGDYQPPAKGQSLARRYLSGFPSGVLGLDPGRQVSDLRDDELESVLGALGGSRRITNILRNTFTPTMVSGGVAQNVIPGVAEAFVDCRILPGVSTDDLLREIAGVIDEPAVELEAVKASTGTESSPDSELFDAITHAIQAERPDAPVVPFLSGGGTDSKHFRPLGMTCYGLIPFEMAETETERMHGIDERVSLENIEHALRVLWRIVWSMCVEDDESR